VQRGVGWSEAARLVRRPEGEVAMFHQPPRSYSFDTSASAMGWVDSYARAARRTSASA